MKKIVTVVAVAMLVIVISCGLLLYTTYTKDCSKVYVNTQPIEYRDVQCTGYDGIVHTYNIVIPQSEGTSMFEESYIKGFCDSIR